MNKQRRRLPEEGPGCQPDPPTHTHTHTSQDIDIRLCIFVIQPRHEKKLQLSLAASKSSQLTVFFSEHAVNLEYNVLL